MVHRTRERPEAGAIHVHYISAIKVKAFRPRTECNALSVTGPIRSRGDVDVVAAERAIGVALELYEGTTSSRRIPQFRLRAVSRRGYLCRAPSSRVFVFTIERISVNDELASLQPNGIAIEIP